MQTSKKSISKSFNNLLKVTADWKQLSTPSVIPNVYDVVRVQYDDARRALYGQGNYAFGVHVQSSRCSVPTLAGGK